MNDLLQQFNELVSQPFLRLDCCSSLCVFCTLAFVGSKIQSQYFNIMSGAALTTFIIILALQLWPAPNVDIAGVFHAIFRAGLAAFLVFISLAVICPSTVFLWKHTFLLAGQWCEQLERDVEKWNKDWALNLEKIQQEDEAEERRLEHERYLASLPPPPPPPVPRDPFEVAEEDYRKALERIEKSSLSPAEKDIAKEDLHEQYARKLFGQ